MFTLGVILEVVANVALAKLGAGIGAGLAAIGAGIGIGRIGSFPDDHGGFHGGYHLQLFRRPGAGTVGGCALRVGVGRSGAVLSGADQSGETFAVSRLKRRAV